MTASTIQAREPLNSSTALPPERDVRRDVWSVLSVMYPLKASSERRAEDRFPYPRLVHLTPLCAGGQLNLDDRIVVAGKHLSERGLGFYHPGALPHRRVVASLEAVSGHWVSFVLHLSWCRFVRDNWYESGGRFLGITATPAILIEN